MGKAISWVLAFLGGIICLGGSFWVGVDQIFSPGSSFWPLPGLVLLDWAVAGILGFLGIVLGTRQAFQSWLKMSGIAIGALIPLMIIGGFSIGPFVLYALLAFLGAALAASWPWKGNVLPYLGWVFIGSISNLGLLWIMIVFGRYFSL